MSDYMVVGLGWVFIFADMRGVVFDFLEYWRFNVIFFLRIDDSI